MLTKKSSVANTAPEPAHSNVHTRPRNNSTATGVDHDEKRQAYHDWETLCNNLHDETVIDQTLLLSSIIHDAECVKARLATFAQIPVYRTQHQADTTHRKFVRIMSRLADLEFFQVVKQEKAWPHQLAIHHQLAGLDRYLRDIESLVWCARRSLPRDHENAIASCQSLTWRWYMCVEIIEDLDRRVTVLSFSFPKWLRKEETIHTWWPPLDA
ncbi:hypothetical protein AbraIFM66950_011017 [Aspergillus brasiliensis]|nr:hypothetical protein AbraIFM66950_011017 [Aspergillus brasiliensis]